LTPLERLVRRRAAREGPLSFAEVMASALYHPRYGYYSRVRGFGAQGDFITSPEVHPVFGQLLARQVVDLWQYLGRPHPFRVLELGAGSGALAEQLLSRLPPTRYTIDERSQSLRKVQRARLGDSVSWHSAARPHLVIANEVLDAQPAHRLTVRQGQLRELRVDADLRWVEMEAPVEARDYFKRLGLLPPEGAIAEINLQLDNWVRQLARRLGPRSLALILDYGYTAEALFSRPQGTLLTYYRHTLGSDPLQRLGEQDISVHVDFTTLATAAHHAGLHVIGVTSQATLLRNLGLLESGGDRRAIWPLVDPNGLGRIGVLFLGRGLEGYVPSGLTHKEALAS
jgi:SAM-dependent MidA family methyltransferase